MVNANQVPRLPTELGASFVFVNGALSVFPPSGAAEVLLDVSELMLVLLAKSVDELESEAPEMEDELSTELVIVSVEVDMCVSLLDGEVVLAATDCVEVTVDVKLFLVGPGITIGITLVLAVAGSEVGYSFVAVAVAGAVSISKLLALASALLKTASGIGVPASPHANSNGIRSTLSSILLSH
jgi:hypothetical protein